MNRGLKLRGPCIPCQNGIHYGENHGFPCTCFCAVDNTPSIEKLSIRSVEYYQKVG